MNLDDIMTYTSVLLSIDTPQDVKDRYFLVLFRELLRQNRIEAERIGIGKESVLRFPEAPDTILEYRPVSTWQAFEGLRKEKGIRLLS